MQKNSMLLVAFMVAIIALGLSAQEQQKQPLSPPGTASVTFADGKTVTIDYSRPSVRNRKIFGGLVPYGQVWRTGANSATSLKTDVPLTFSYEGLTNTIPAGSYTIYTIPDAKKWTLIINKETGQWGTDYDEKQDQAWIPMKVATNASPTEQFRISLEKSGGNAATLKLDWADTSASVNLTEKK
jgi:Protein of unknown function (DUF2911)